MITMFPLLSKMLLYKSFYYLGFPKVLPINYTISLTYRCNSKCSTCNVYKRNAVELSKEEYKKIFKSIGKSPYWVTFSGGELFLRKDFVEIVKCFYDICKPKIINIPTNGLLVQKILSSVQEICEYCKKSQVVVNLSIDEVGVEHDQIRSVPGNYDKVILLFHKLKKMRIKNLSIGIHSVISKFNIGNFAKVANHMMLLSPDQYITEIAETRDELQTMGLDITPDPLHYKAAVDFLIHRIKHMNFPSKFNKIVQAFRIEYYTLANAILKFKTQVIPCYAGIASLQISPDGEVWSCCVKAKAIGYLRKSNYNLKRIWNSSKFTKERLLIKNKKCYCPLANAAYTNMLLEPKTLSRVFYRSFIKWWQ